MVAHCSLHHGHFDDLQKTAYTSNAPACSSCSASRPEDEFRSAMEFKRWLFTREAILDSPNHRLLKDPECEFSTRVRAAAFTQEIGEKLRLSQHTTSIATVYYHRFYMKFSIKDIDKKEMSIASIFVAAKAHGEYRSLEHVIKVGFAIMNPRNPDLDAKSEMYRKIRENITTQEEFILRLFGFDMEVQLPHQYVVQIHELLKGDIEVAKKAYRVATASIVASTFCLQYRPETVACICYNLAAGLTRKEIPAVIEERPWFDSISNSLTAESLKEMTADLEKTIRKAHRVANCYVLNCVLNDAPAVPTQKRPLMPETSQQTNNKRVKVQKIEDLPKLKSIENKVRSESPLRTENKKEDKNINIMEKMPEASTFPKYAKTAKNIWVHIPLTSISLKGLPIER